MAFQNQKLVFGHKISNNIWKKGSLKDNMKLKFYYFGPAYFIYVYMREMMH